MAGRTISLHMHTSHTRFSARTQAPLWAGSISTQLILAAHMNTRMQPKRDEIGKTCGFTVWTSNALKFRAEVTWFAAPPPVIEFMATEFVPSSSRYQSWEGVKLMSHGGREERSRKTWAERKTETVVGRRRAPFRNGFDPSVRQFYSNFLPLLQKHVGEKRVSGG